MITPESTFDFVRCTCINHNQSLAEGSCCRQHVGQACFANEIGWVNEEPNSSDLGNYFTKQFETFSS